MCITSQSLDASLAESDTLERPGKIATQRKSKGKRLIPHRLFAWMRLHAIPLRRNSAAWYVQRTKSEHERGRIGSEVQEGVANGKWNSTFGGQGIGYSRQLAGGAGGAGGEAPQRRSPYCNSAYPGSRGGISPNAGVDSRGTCGGLQLQGDRAVVFASSSRSRVGPLRERLRRGHAYSFRQNALLQLAGPKRDLGESGYARAVSIPYQSSGARPVG